MSGASQHKEMPVLAINDQPCNMPHAQQHNNSCWQPQYCQQQQRDFPHMTEVNPGHAYVPDESFCLVISLVLPQHAAEYSCCAMHAQQIRLVHVTTAYCW
jgi:hypothetical protein